MLPAVQQDVSMGDQLACLRAGLCKAGAIDDIVQASLEQCEQFLTGVACATCGHCKVTAELFLEHAVKAFETLLFADADAVVREFPSTPAVHAGRVVSFNDGALRRIAASSLKVELDAFSSAELALGS